MAARSVGSDLSAGRLALGVCGVVGLLAAVLAAEAVAGDAIEALRSALGSDYLVAAALGVVALVVGASALASARGSSRQVSMPEAERPTPVPAPGDGFDERLRGWRARTPLLGRERRAAARDRLRNAAIETVAAERNCDRAPAERLVDDGAWTDDPVAAAFLGDGVARPRVAARLAALSRRETWLEYRARRAGQVIAARRGIEGEDDG